jgi:hypothetical protein
MPVPASALAQRGRQLVVQRGEVGDVLFRVSELAGAQRTLQPIRARFVLRNGDAQHRGHQLLVAEPRAHPAQSRRDLGIEQVERRVVQQRHQDFQVLAGTVHHARAARDQRAHVRGDIVGGRIKQPAFVRMRGLHQRQLRVKGIAAHELGVESDRGAVRKGGDGVRAVDPGGAHGAPLPVGWCSIVMGFAIVNRTR